MASLHRVLDSHGAVITRPHDGFFVSLDGRWYSYHFWVYPLLALPAKAVLRLLRADEFGALAWTNAWMLVGAVAWALHGARRLSRVAFLALAMLGPLLWYVRWPHAEVFAWACVVLSVVSLEHRRYVRAARCGSRPPLPPGRRRSGRRSSSSCRLELPTSSPPQAARIPRSSPGDGSGLSRSTWIKT